MLLRAWRQLGRLAAWAWGAGALDAADNDAGSPAFDLDALPQELLERVLAWLPPAQVVEVRAVCRRWRAAADRIDAPVPFTCGARDLLRHAPWLQQERARLLSAPRHRWDWRWRWRDTAGHGDVDNELADTLKDFLYRVAVNDGLPCTCGAGGLLETGQRLLDAEPHDSRLRPARWALLAPERALAFQVSAVAMSLFRHCNILDLIYYSHGGGCTHQWLPVWYFLPTGVRRPANAMELVHLAHRLVCEYVPEGEHPLLAKLADPDFARSFYDDHATSLSWGWHGEHAAASASAPVDWEDPVTWMNASFPAGKRGPQLLDRPAADIKDALGQHDEFHETTEAIQDGCPLFEDATTHVRASDPTGFEEVRLNARQSAAGWRICRALGWMPWLHSDPGGIGFDAILGRLGGGRSVDMSDDALQAYLDGQVAVTDQTVAEIRRLLRHAVVSSNGRSEDPLWIFGLSPGGHLVGAISHVSPTH